MVAELDQGASTISPSLFSGIHYLLKKVLVLDKIGELSSDLLSGKCKPHTNLDILVFFSASFHKREECRVDQGIGLRWLLEVCHQWIQPRKIA